MSNPFKAIGKAFKAVVKTVKKVALPALAIGAVVLTGGAALGILPSVGSLAGSLGLSTGLTSVLTMAAKSATFGAIGSLLTGGNPVKGATFGFLAGGALGAAGAMFGGPATAANAAGTGAAQTASASAGGAGSAAVGGAAASNAATAWGGTGSFGSLGTGAGNGLGAAAAGGAGGGVAAATGAGSAVLAPVVSSAAPVASGGGILGFLNQNPMISGMALNGLGQGMIAKEQSKQAQREREQIAANYADTSGFFRYDPAAGGGLGSLPGAADRYNAAVYGGKVMYDPKTGKITPAGAA